MVSTRFERYLKYVVKGDGCWEWTGATNEHGYGRLAAGLGKNFKAHRVSWELHNGPIPDGMNVLHRCDNPPCTNPEHLFLGTQKDNTRDMVSKLRMKYGEKASWSKLTEEQVRSILSDSRPQRVIAQEYGICQQSVSSIKRRINWKHLD